jgi:hypothetical protein
MNWFCCKNSLTVRDVVVIVSLAPLWDVAKIFFATEPEFSSPTIVMVGLSSA